MASRPRQFLQTMRAETTLWVALPDELGRTPTVVYPTRGPRDAPCPAEWAFPLPEAWR
ncbi:MAG TPA: hypothetical protein VEE83_01995 [Thermoplasmata archaeon]|nr:hypothetical protein [Thermoplasmata archaeon]